MSVSHIDCELLRIVKKLTSLPILSIPLGITWYVLFGLLLLLLLLTAEELVEELKLRRHCKGEDQEVK
jgi:uncharacterized protein (DUF58 family)